MKEKGPIDNLFIEEPSGGQPAKDGGRPSSPCGHCPLLCPEGVAVDLKR
jgi:hypothetical protein